MNYTDRGPILTVFGILLLLVGIAAALLGPVETYCFYLFSEGGRFHYPGFGFGSFMFGNIAAQIIGYYVIAALLIPLGYGHLRAHRWVRKLSLALLWSWLVVGIPLMVAFFFILAGSKELSPIAAIIAVIALAVSYFLLPWLLIRFYHSRDLRLTLQAMDPDPHPVERFPTPLLALTCLYLFYAVVVHVPLFFRGIFPFFGTFLFDLRGFILVDAVIALLLILAWGTIRSRVWAWWGSLLTIGLLTLSTILTFLRSSYLGILESLRFPPTEMEILDGIPLEGVHLAVFFGLPLLATLAVIVLSRRHFGRPSPSLSQ